MLQPRDFAPGELIVRKGDPADEILLLMRGLASVTVEVDGVRRQRLSTVSPGMVFGELTIVDRSPRTADVRADTPVECLVLSAVELDSLGRTHPALKLALLTNLLRNVHQVVARLGQQVIALGG
jgi:glutaminase